MAASSWSICPDIRDRSNTIMMDPGRRPHWAGRRALCPQVASLGLGQAVTKRDAERVELGGQFEHLTRIQSGAISARQLAILGLSRETIAGRVGRSEEHTSELQSRGHLVCRLL